jgi:hypothetical protein
MDIDRSLSRLEVVTYLHRDEWPDKAGVALSFVPASCGLYPTVVRSASCCSCWMLACRNFGFVFLVFRSLYLSIGGLGSLACVFTGELVVIRPVERDRKR